MALDYSHTKIDKPLKTFANLIKRRLRKDWDIVIAITGEEGSGKSTLGLLLGGLIDNTFDLDRNVSYLPDEKEIRDEFSALRKYQCYVIDEAIRSLYKMNFMSNLQKSLIQMWATERYQNKATILILPRFKDLTENFRNHRVKIWIFVLERGVALVRVREDDPDIVDPWNFDFISRLKMKRFKKTNINLMPVDERLKFERKARNYLFDFTFPDLHPIDKERYNYLKHESRVKYLEEQKTDTGEGKVTKALRDNRDFLIYYLFNYHSKGKFNDMLEDFSDTLNLSIPTIKKIIKKGRENKKKLVEQEERTNSYIGVERFLDNAIALEKTKNLES